MPKKPYRNGRPYPQTLVPGQIPVALTKTAEMTGRLYTDTVAQRLQLVRELSDVCETAPPMPWTLVLLPGTTTLQQRRWLILHQLLRQLHDSRQRCFEDGDSRRYLVCSGAVNTFATTTSNAATNPLSTRTMLAMDTMTTPMS